jgi:hypothetical protein
MTLFNGNSDTGPVFEKGYPKHEGHEEYMKRRMKEEDEKNFKPTFEQQILEIKEDIKKLQIDLAYMIKKYEN